MTTVGDLLDRDFTRPLEEAVRLTHDDPGLVFTELGEYMATDRLVAEYETLFDAIATSAKSGKESIAVWISGFFGSGKSSFAKNAAHVLANRSVGDESATSLFSKRVQSRAIAETVEFLHRSIRYEAFMLDGQRNDFKAKLFDAVETAHPGKTPAFIIDDIGDLANTGDDARNFRMVLESFAELSAKRVVAGKIAGPTLIIATSEQKPPDTLTHCFTYQIDLSSAGIAEVAARRVLRKKESHEFLLKTLFREHGAALARNLRLERCARDTDLDEDQFVRFYPFFPHLIELSIDIVAGIRLHPNTPRHIPDGSRSIVKQCSDLLMSEPVRLAEKPIGALVSIDQIYDLLELSLPPEKQHDVQTISEHSEHKDHPGMAARVVKAICLMEFVKADLPRTTANIAALLVSDVKQVPPTAAVATVLNHMREAWLVRETAQGWTLHEYDFDELHRRTAALAGLQRAVGGINPRPPGWRNDLIQTAKKSLARVLSWYTQGLRHFSCSVTRSLEDIVSALYPLVDLPIEMLVLQRRLAQSETQIASLQQQIELLNDQIRTLTQNGETEVPALERTRLQSRERTAYVLGLFGSGRLYVCELIQHHIGERAKYFRDAIRLHPGPTPMIYSGHATIKRISRGQNPPAVTSRILEDVRRRSADLIFIYRHPLDSLLTNWIWWRTRIRDGSCSSGIAQLYSNTEDLYSVLEKNFLEFKAFADGDPRFFADAEPGPRFLSFTEFVEETEHYLQSGLTISLRFEDFIFNPLKEFSKIAEVMSADADLTGMGMTPPKSKPYRYSEVKDNVPQFRRFIDGLNAATQKKIDRIGYTLAS